MTIMGPRNRSSFALAVCRRLFPAVAATAILLSAGLASAAELEGFGPIKFGMTKEQAWEAIEGRGEWIAPDTLNYAVSAEYPSKFEIDVNQEFAERKAADVTADFSIPGALSEQCAANALYFADLIRLKYEISPEINLRGPGETKAGDKKSYLIEDSFEFMFPSGASIRVEMTYRYASTICDLFVYYRIARGG